MHVRALNKNVLYSKAYRREAHRGFWWGNLREGGHLKDQEVNGRIILKWLFDKWGGGVNWNDLAQDRNRWWALVNAVMNLRVS
jgi:hypothetical protein